MCWNRNGRAVRLLAAASILAIASLLSAFPATTRASYYGPPLGSLYLSFEPDRRVENRHVDPFHVFDFYLIADFDFADIGHPEWNATTGMEAYELGIVLPASILIGQMQFFPEGASAWGMELKNGVLTMMVPFAGNCALAQDSPQVMIHFTGLLVEDAHDVFLAITPYDPSSFSVGMGGPGAVPGWLKCPADADTLYPFAHYTQEATFAVNRTGLPATQASWGALKAAYDE